MNKMEVNLENQYNIKYQTYDDSLKIQDSNDYSSSAYILDTGGSDSTQASKSPTQLNVQDQINKFSFQNSDIYHRDQIQAQTYQQYRDRGRSIYEEIQSNQGFIKPNQKRQQTLKKVFDKKRLNIQLLSKQKFKQILFRSNKHLYQEWKKNLYNKNNYISNEYEVSEIREDSDEDEDDGIELQNMKSSRRQIIQENNAYKQIIQTEGIDIEEIQDDDMSLFDMRQNQQLSLFYNSELNSQSNSCLSNNIFKR